MNTRLFKQLLLPTLLAALPALASAAPAAVMVQDYISPGVGTLLMRWWSMLW
jgi:hypothetical protein